MSSKKQFDHIEAKIKQAAENNLPPFDEKGWQLMEAKLDKENKKRRPFLWWFVLPLLLAGGWGGYQLLKTPGKDIAKTETIKKEIGKQDDKATANKDSEKVVKVDENKDKSEVGVSGDLNKINAAVTEGKNSNDLIETNSKRYSDRSGDGNSKLFRPGKIKGKRNGKMSSHVSGGPEEDMAAGKKDVSVLNTSIAKVSENIKDVSDVNKNITKAGDDKKDKPVVSDATNDKSVNDNKLSEQVKADDEKTVAAKEEVKEEKKKEVKEKDKKSNKGFYLLATGGTDAGSTKLFSYSNSSITPKYGFGVGYQFNNRLSVQTGFYASNKKYVAGKDDYAAKSDPYWQYVTKVKAACLIYEIPLTVKVDLIKKPSFTVYGTIGSSFYIMKTEDYDYVYEYYGQEHEYAWGYTGNKHSFSTLNFSIGIEKKLSNKFSLLAEPSFGIPLKGVGDGKVKLYSSALQVGIKYRF